MKQYHKGFTLIEVLFIIAVFAVLATLVIASYQQRTVTQKVEKTALQMQEIVQAANAYFEDNSTWPNSTTPTNNFIDNYLPVGLSQNPWGGAYLYAFNGTQFVVNSGSLPNSNLALRIQSLLPNAIINPNDPMQVLITPPLNQPANNLIQVIGTTQPIADGQSLPESFPITCPSGTTPQAFALPQVFMEYSNDYDDCFNNISRPFGTLNAPVTCLPNGNSYNCNMTVAFNGVLPKRSGGLCWTSSDTSRGNGTMTFTYIAWCQ